MIHASPPVSVGSMKPGSDWTEPHDKVELEAMIFYKNKTFNT